VVLVAIINPTTVVSHALHVLFNGRVEVWRFPRHPIRDKVLFRKKNPAAVLPKQVIKFY
jgi:hypothetical protein